MAGTRKIALAYSGGFDTAVAVPWLIENYEAEVECVVVDVGQGLEDLEGIEARAASAGAVGCHVVDVRDSFVEEFIWPTLRASAVYGRKGQVRAHVRVAGSRPRRDRPVARVGYPGTQGRRRVRAPGRRAVASGEDVEVLARQERVAHLARRGTARGSHHDART